MKDWPGLQASFVLLVAAAALSTLTLVGKGNLFMQADKPAAKLSVSPMRLPATQAVEAQVGVSTAQVPDLFSPDTGHELIQFLKENNLWDVAGKLEIPPVIVAHFPDDLTGVTVEERNRAFVHSLLPLVMIVQEEVKQERARLLRILNELGGQQNGIYFAQGKPVWQEALSQENVQFIFQLTKKYRTDSASELLNRIDVLPASLVIAQAAIESSWGSSRFAKEANNIFGMWTWGKKGIVPARREEGKTHKIALYDSVLDSVRAYVLTLNRVWAYKKLRAIRSRTQDPMLISEGLLKYSERGEFYVADVKRVIERYKLIGYDKFRLKLSAG